MQISCKFGEKELIKLGKWPRKTQIFSFSLTRYPANNPGLPLWCRDSQEIPQPAVSQVFWSCSAGAKRHSGLCLEGAGRVPIWYGNAAVLVLLPGCLAQLLQHGDTLQQEPWGLLPHPRDACKLWDVVCCGSTCSILLSSQHTACVSGKGWAFLFPEIRGKLPIAVPVSGS